MSLSLRWGLVLACVSVATVQEASAIGQSVPVSKAAFPAGVAGNSSLGQTSADGRYTVFVSDAVNLAAGQDDSNNANDVFLHDALTDSVTLVSGIDGGNTTGDGSSNSPVISADGGYIAFRTRATNLKTGVTDGNLTVDIYVYDRATSGLTLVSGIDGGNTTGNGTSSPPVISADGGYVAFQTNATNLKTGVTDSNGQADIYVYDRATPGLALVSGIDGGNTTGNGGSFSPVISADGGYIAFQTNATNLKTGVTDSNGQADVYVYDRITPGQALVSGIDGGSTPGNGSSESPVISADGGYIAFVTFATNLKTGVTDGNGQADVYVYNRAAPGQALVSGIDGGNTTGNSTSFSPGISADGGYIVFETFATNLKTGVTDGNADVDIYVYDRATPGLALVSGIDGGNTTGDKDSSLPVISADGAYIVFETDATNLKTGVTDSNREEDVYVYDRVTPGQALVSGIDGGNTTGNGSSDRPVISADGGYIVFRSTAKDLVDGDVVPGGEHLLRCSVNTLAKLRITRQTPGMSGDMAGESSNARVSADGRYTVFVSSAVNLAAGQDDSNNANDVFLYDALTDSVTLVSGIDGGNTTGNGASLSPVISADGGYIAFQTDATNLKTGVTDGNGQADVYVYDRATPGLALVSGIDGGNITGSSFSETPVISADGGYVAFATFATNLKTGVTDGNGQADVYVYDRATPGQALVSGIDGGSTTGNSASLSPAISADGGYIAFRTSATNLKTGVTDSNGQADVYVYDRATPSLALVSGIDGGNTTGNGGSPSHVISADGGYIAFVTSATNLKAGVTDGNGQADVYVYDRVTPGQALVSGIDGGNTTGNGASLSPVISADGGYIAFQTDATNLKTGVTDGNGQADIYVYDRATPSLALVSGIDGGNTPGSNASFAPVISADGGSIAFLTTATNLKSGVTDYNLSADVFLSVSDRVPDSFGFSPAIGVEPGTEITSDVATITGIDTPAVASVINGSYSIGCLGSFITGPSAIENGQTVCVRHLSAAGSGQSVTTTLTIGGVSAGFTSKTFGINALDVQSLTRASPSPTNASAVAYLATFSRAVTGVDATDFIVVGMGLDVAGVDISVSGSGSTYTVTVEGVSGTGTLFLQLVDDDSIAAVDDGAVLGGAGVGNGDFVGETYVIDTIGPSVTVDQVVSQPDPAFGVPVDFEVQFSEAVTGFDASDVVLSGSALPTTAVVTGGPSAYTVSVSGMSANGTVSASVLAGAVSDAVGNASLASTSSDSTVTFQGFAPDVGFTLSSQGVNEGTGLGTTTVTVTATLSISGAVTITVPFAVDPASTATDGLDYGITASEFSFPPGMTTATVTVNISRDALDEPDESLILVLQPPVIATLGLPDTQTITITDDDAAPQVNLSVGGSNLAENGGTVTATATLSAVSGLDVTVNLVYGGTATHPDDYTRSAEQIVIPAGGTSGAVVLTGVDDGITEGDESVTITLGTLTNATAGPSSAVSVTINDDDKSSGGGGVLDWLALAILLALRALRAQVRRV